MWEIQNTPGIGKKNTFAAKSTPGKPSGTLKATSDAPATPASLLKKTTAAAKSSPAQPPSAAKSQGTRLGADADVAAMKASPEAAACDSGTLCLKECVVKCVPAKTPHGPGSDANDSAAARRPTGALAASDAEATCEPVTKTLRRSLSRSSAQTEDNKMETPTPREASASQGDGVVARRRRGRPSKASTQKKSDEAQAEEGQAATSGAHPVATTLRLKPCLVNCVPPRGRAKSDEPADPSRPPASAPTEDGGSPLDGAVAHTGALAPAVVKRRPGRPSKADAKKRAQVAIEAAERSHEVPSPPTSSAPPESHSAPAAPETAEGAPTLTAAISRGGSGDRRGAAAELGTSGPSRAGMSEEKDGGERAEKAMTQTMAREAASSRGGKRKKVGEGKETTNPEGAQKAKAKTEESTPSPGGTRRSGEGFEKEESARQQGGKGRARGATKESAPGRPETSEVKEGNLEETEQKGGEGGEADVTADAPGREEKVKRQQRKETEQPGGDEPKTDLTTPSPGEDSKTPEGKTEQTEREGGEGEKAQVSIEESAPRRGRKRKPAEISETERKRGEERKAEDATEEPATTGEKTKRGGAQAARQPRGEEAQTESTADESTPGREGKMKRRERRETERAGADEGKAAESTPGPGEATAKTAQGTEEGTERGGGEERITESTAGESTPGSREGKMKRKDGEEDERGGGETEPTAEESTPGRGERSTANQGQRERIGRTEGGEGKTKAATEESAPGRGDDSTATGEERKTTERAAGEDAEPEATAPRRGGKRRRREGAAKEAGRPAKTEAEPAPRRPRGTKTTRAHARQDGEKGAGQGSRNKDGGGERTRRSRKEDAGEGGGAAKDKQGSHVDDERQRRLAAKRESVLKSLRGLLKATRGGRRREAAAKSFTKAAIRVKTKRMRGHKMLQEANAGKKSRLATPTPAVGNPCGKPPAAAAAKESGSKLIGGPEPQEPPKKDARKLIGKIVKATAKVHVKTMMGGATLPPPQEGEAATSGGRTAAHSSEEERKPQRVLTDDEKAATKRRHEKDAAKAGGAAPGRKSAGAAGARGRESAADDERSCGSGEDVRQETKKNLTPTDSTLHRIHGDIRISLKSDTPDVAKCLAALDQLSGIYVTSQHVQRHSELISTLRKMRFYRANQDIMDKAAMLYNRFKNAFLLGEGDEVVSAAFLRSLLEEKEREEEERCKKYERAAGDEEGEVPAHRPPSAD
uniref:Hepatoma-derived growth factor-related protein 2-like n=1 Tax=Hippocampus comes TaxID=109280 RepID=A0A3Q3DEK5_HIPCM